MLLQLGVLMLLALGLELFELVGRVAGSHSRCPENDLAKHDSVGLDPWKVMWPPMDVCLHLSRDSHSKGMVRHPSELESFD
jgi:hypothetical protein